MPRLVCDLFWTKGALVILVIALALTVAVVSTPHWLQQNPSSGIEHCLGLWDHCLTNISVNGTIRSCGLNVPGMVWFQAVRAFTVLGLLVMMFTTSLLSAYGFMERLQQNTFLLSSSIIFCFITGSLLLISITIFSSLFDKTGVFEGKEPERLDFAFFLCLAAALLCLLSGVFAYIQYKEYMEDVTVEPGSSLWLDPGPS